MGHRALPDFFARFGDAFRLEMEAFVAACRGEQPSPLTLNDATEATRIGQAITQSLRLGFPAFSSTTSFSFTACNTSKPAAARWSSLSSRR